MRFKSLIIKNILAYGEETKFELDDSLTYIIGPNGSGKSTIIDAINLALYRKAIRTSNLSSLLLLRF